MNRTGWGRWTAWLCFGALALAVSGCGSGGDGGAPASVTGVAEANGLGADEDLGPAAAIALLEQDEPALDEAEAVEERVVLMSAKASKLPKAVRAAARAAGLSSLAEVPTPEVENLDEFLNRGKVAEKAALLLGKALFWDMQVGSDGQACASCHFHAGADSRASNQLSPGLKNQNPDLQGIFDPTATGGGGPDYTLVETDFPFRQLNILNEESTPGEKRASEVVFDTDDVTSSMGAFSAAFAGVTPGVPTDQGLALLDPIFNLGNVVGGGIATNLDDNVRRVEPRNTPTMINAVFNHSNFWDGRAHNEFNGVSVIGPLDEAAAIWVREGRSLVQRQVRIPNSSLASQAVGPPLSNLEMSFFDRPFPLLGRKLLSLRPLGLQLVHGQDSVLGPFSRAPFGKPGLCVSYRTLIMIAFQPQYWLSSQQTPEGFDLMEANFSLFFGLAVQMYESTLVSDQTAFDRFMAGKDNALSEEELLGLLAFLNRGLIEEGGRGNLIEVQAAIDAAEQALGLEIGAGNCISCHGSAMFSDAALPSLTDPATGELELAEVEEAPELEDVAGNGILELVVGKEEVLLDNGFSNIGVRRTNEDLGRGGMEGGFPLAFVRQAFLDPELLPEEFELECLATTGGCPQQDQMDGAFKIAGLRNAELTGPYFHNGGESTLQQVIEFYNRQGNFTGTAADEANLANVDRNMAFVNFDEADEEPLVEFLLALTDDRVRNERAPFDHPQLFVPNGGTFVSPALEIRVPAVGKQGRKKEGLPPLGTFLDLPPFEEGDEG